MELLDCFCAENRKWNCDPLIFFRWIVWLPKHHSNSHIQLLLNVFQSSYEIWRISLWCHLSCEYSDLVKDCSPVKAFSIFQIKLSTSELSETLTNITLSYSTICIIGTYSFFCLYSFLHASHFPPFCFLASAQSGCRDTENHSAWFSKF